MRPNVSRCYRGQLQPWANDPSQLHSVNLEDSAPKIPGDLEDIKWGRPPKYDEAPGNGETCKHD